MIKSLTRLIRRLLLKKTMNYLRDEVTAEVLKAFKEYKKDNCQRRIEYQLEDNIEDIFKHFIK